MKRIPILEPTAVPLRNSSGKGMVEDRLLEISLMSLFLFFIATIFWGCSQDCRPIETEAQARAALKVILQQREKDFPGRFKIINIDKQITNVRVSGPRMTFDPPGRRYIDFDFDTGCGASVQPLAIVDECGAIVNLTPWGNLCAASEDAGGYHDEQPSRSLG